MELTGEVKEEAPTLRRAPHPSNDPQECGALRQGDIALIHSAPTGEKILVVKMRACAAANHEAPHRWAAAEFFSVPCCARTACGSQMKEGSQRRSMPAMGLLHRRELL